MGGALRSMWLPDRLRGDVQKWLETEWTVDNLLKSLYFDFDRKTFFATLHGER